MGMRKVFLVAVLISLLIMNGNWISSIYAKDNINNPEVVVENPVININTATVEQLQLIRGIGPKLAARIINYRNENGKFETINDIMNVRGVGSSKFEKIKENLKV